MCKHRYGGSKINAYFCEASSFPEGVSDQINNILRYNSFFLADGDHMRAVIQRVKSAQVTVENEICGHIQHGMLILLGLAKDDDFAQGQKLLDKVLAYRMFSDTDGKMSLNVNQVDGGVLLVSQFTLLANTQKGLRPDFGPAMPPQAAQTLYDQLVQYLRQQHPALQTGIFAADMQVGLVNDGPVTFILES